MLTSSLAYIILSKDMPKSLSNVASQASVKADAQYYSDNINKIKTVDDFLGNYRVYSYAMKAYGLEDMTYAKAMMKKVLESDLTDSNSYANRLSDTRYKNFAAAFNFNAPAPDAQTSAQEDDMLGLYTQSFADQEKQAATETTYYGNNIDSVQNVNDLLGNSRMRDYVLKTYNIDPTYASNSFLSDVLTGAITDPTVLGPKYTALQAQFSFNADGTVNGAAQTTTQKNAVMEQYNLTTLPVVIDNASPTADLYYTTQAAANYNKTYYESHIGSITNVDQLIADKRLTSYIKAAYNSQDSILPGISDSGLRQVLTDPGYADSLGLKDVFFAFNFNNDGTTSTSEKAQSLSQSNVMTGTAAGVSGTYANAIQSGQWNGTPIANVDDLLAIPQMTQFIKNAVGLADSYSDADLRQVLTDQTFASTAGLSNVYGMFNFSADGTLPTGVPIQTGLQINTIQAMFNSNGSNFSRSAAAATSVDDLMANATAISYLKTAYGMPAGTSDADVKKILTDPAFASSSGYSSVHDAFNFKADGSLAHTFSTQNIDQLNSTLAKAKTAKDAFYGALANVTNVDDLIASPAMTSFVKTTFNLPQTMSDADLKKVLTDPAYASSNGYGSAHDAFNFQADGSIDPNTGLQTSVQGRDTATLSSANADYFQNKIGTIGSIDDLLADTRLTSFIKNAYGLDMTMPDATFKSILTDPTFAASQGFSEVNAAFNFAADGTSAGSSNVQNSLQTSTTSTQYMARYNLDANTQMDDAIDNYKTIMAGGATTGTFSDVKNVDDFLRSNSASDFSKSNDKLPDLYHMALQAFGLTDEEVPRSMMRKILKSDAYDPKGYIASLKDDRITNMARSFNFGSDGKLAPALAPLSAANMAKYATQYKTRVTMLLKDGPQKDQVGKDATKAIDTFAKGMDQVKNLDDLLSNSDLTKVILTANGLDPKKYTKDTLTKIFTSDPADPKSYLNTKADAIFKDIVADFNFDKSGNLTRAKIGITQDQAAEDRTQKMFLQQTLEAQQGEQNDGTRLALYFARKASGISSFYDILGDKALFQVVQTAFSLPTQMSGMDVDQQVSLLQRFVQLQDFSDPTKVDKLLKRFTAMYDLQNSTTQSAALQILTGGGSSSS